MAEAAAYPPQEHRPRIEMLDQACDPPDWKTFSDGFTGESWIATDTVQEIRP